MKLEQSTEALDGKQKTLTFKSFCNFSREVRDLTPNLTMLLDECIFPIFPLQVPPLRLCFPLNSMIKIT